MTNKLLNSDAALQWSELFFRYPWTIVALLTRCKAKDFSSFSVRGLVHPRSCAVALACTTNETKPLVMPVCETVPESLFWSST